MQVWAIVALALVAISFHLPKPAIVCIGDSITCGRPGFDPNYTLPTGMDESSQYEYWMARRLPGYRVINRGVSGNSTRDMLNRFQRDVIEASPRYVVILGGVNDDRHRLPESDTIRNIRSMVDQAQAAGIRPILCTITPSGEYHNVTAHNAEIKALAAEMHLPCVDLYAALVDPGRPGYCIHAYTTDGLHPSVDGYQVMGEAIAATLAVEWSY